MPSVVRVFNTGYPVTAGRQAGHDWLLMPCFTVMKKHPLNQSFVWRQPEPPYELVTEEQARAYREVGGFVLEDAFSPDEVASVRAALDPLADEANAYLSQVPADQPTIAREDEIVFRPHLVKVNQVAREFAAHPVFQALCRDLIGAPARL